MNIPISVVRVPKGSDADLKMPITPHDVRLEMAAKTLSPLFMILNGKSFSCFSILIVQKCLSLVNYTIGNAQKNEAEVHVAELLGSAVGRRLRGRCRQFIPARRSVALKRYSEGLC